MHKRIALFCLLASLSIGLAAQNALPGGAQVLKLWPGYRDASHYGIARSGSSYFVLTDQGAQGPFDSVSPLESDRECPATSFIAKRGASTFIVGSSGELLGPYIDIDMRKLEKDEAPSRGKAYRCKRQDDDYDLVFDDGIRARTFGTYDAVYIAVSAISSDGLHCSVPVTQDSTNGVLWDGVFIPLPSLFACVGFALGGDLLFVEERAGDYYSLTALTRGSAVNEINRGYKTPLFHDMTDTILSTVLPMPEGYRRFVYGRVDEDALRRFGIKNIELFPIGSTVPPTILPASYGFALGYNAKSVDGYLLTATDLYGPFFPRIERQAEYAVSPSGKTLYYSTGKLDDRGGYMEVHKGAASYGRFLYAGDFSFMKGDEGLYWMGGRMSGDCIYRDGAAISPIADTAKIIREVLLDRLPGGNSWVQGPFEGLYSIFKDDKSSLYRIAGANAPHELVAGPYDGQGLFAVSRSGNRRIVSFNPYGDSPCIVDGVKVEASVDVSGFAATSDGSSFAFIATQKKGKENVEYICLGDARFGPFADCSVPAFLPGTSKLVFVCSDNKGLRIQGSDGSSIPLKGTSLNPLALNVVNVSPDGKVLEVSGSGKAPGAAKGDPAISYTYVIVDGATRVGFYDPVSNATAYWDEKAKCVQRIAH